MLFGNASCLQLVYISDSISLTFGTGFTNCLLFQTKALIPVPNRIAFVVKRLLRNDVAEGEGAMY